MWLLASLFFILKKIIVLPIYLIYSAAHEHASGSEQEDFLAGVCRGDIGLGLGFGHFKP